MNEFLQGVGALTILTFLCSVMMAIVWSYVEVKSLQKKYDALESLLNSVECKAINTQNELRKLLNKLEKTNDTTIKDSI